MEDLIKELFPDALINQSSWMGHDYFTVALENAFIHFSHDTITDREKRLILKMLEPEIVLHARNKNIWAHYLLENASAVPEGYDCIQILQVSFKQNPLEENDQKLWLDAFKNTLAAIIDGFFVSDHYALFIIHNPEHFEFYEEIEGILNVLDDDFGIQTHAYIGQNWTVNQFLPALFSEEQNIFLDTRSHSHREQILTLSATALPHYTFEASKKSPILATIKDTIQNVNGGADLVYAMWQNQGNISKAAVDLYVHRNTLQYRIERFLDTVGLNLKKMDDLLLSYMALNARFSE